MSGAYLEFCKGGFLADRSAQLVHFNPQKKKVLYRLQWSTYGVTQIANKMLAISS